MIYVVLYSIVWYYAFFSIYDFCFSHVCLLILLCFALDVLV
jgi:hypothetical protein